MGIRIGHALWLFGGFSMRSFRADIHNKPTDGMIHPQAEGVSQPDGVMYLAPGGGFL